MINWGCRDINKEQGDNSRELKANLFGLLNLYSFKIPSSLLNVSFQM